MHIENAVQSQEYDRHRMTPLREIVNQYVALAATFGTPVKLAAFNLSRNETERLFSDYEQDYHISRFLHFSEQDGEPFLINGFPATHVSIDAEVSSLL